MATAKLVDDVNPTQRDQSSGALVMPHNTQSREEAFAELREDIGHDPSLAQGMLPEHKRLIGLE